MKIDLAKLSDKELVEFACGDLNTALRMASRDVINELLQLGEHADEMREKGYSGEFVAGLRRGYRTALNLLGWPKPPSNGLLMPEKE